MSGLDIFILAVVATGLGFALFHIKRNKGCGCSSCDGNCGSCRHKS